MRIISCFGDVCRRAIKTCKFAALFILVVALMLIFFGCKSSPPAGDLVKIEFKRSNAMAYSDLFTLDKSSAEALHESIETGGNIVPNNPTYAKQSFNIDSIMWAEAEQLLIDCNVSAWKEKYSNSAAVDGTIWKITLTYSDGTVVTSTGYNKYPAEYKRLSYGFDTLFARDENPSPQPMPPAEGDSFAMGNTPGNYANPIEALEFEGNTYVTLRRQGQTSVVVLAPDGVALSDLPKASQALDGWLYYLEDGQIRRVNSGTEPETILEAGHRIVD